MLIFQYIEFFQNSDFTTLPGRLCRYSHLEIGMYVRLGVHKLRTQSVNLEIVREDRRLF